MQAVVLLTALILGQAPPQRTLPMPSDAVDLAWQDAQRFSDPRGLRYVWISGKYGPQLVEDNRVVGYAVDLVNHTSGHHKPVLLSNGKTVIARIDTKRLTNDEAEWLGLAGAWEAFRFDPRFNALVTQGQVELARLNVDGVSRRWITTDGVRSLEIEAAADALKRDGVVRQFPRHLSVNWFRLAAALETEAPIVDHRYFVFRAMSTIRDADDKRPLYSTLYGGLYYDLAGIPVSKQKGVTDLDLLLEQLGVGQAKGKKAAQLFRELRSDRRLAMFESRITLKPRRIFRFNSLLGADHQGLVLITDDFFEKSIDIDQDPLANLLKTINEDADAHEMIFERRNGQHGFALFNRQGQRQDEVPPEIAKDKTPSGRLQCASGCIFCHAAGGGWQGAENDVLAMLKTGKWDVFGDLSRTDQRQAVQDIVLQYQGRFEIPFERGRDDYARSILTVTGPWPGSKTQTDTVQQVATRMRWIFEDYWYDKVSAKEALAEMGYEVDAGRAPEVFSRLVMNRGQGITLEPPAVAGIRTGRLVKRIPWDLSYGHIAR